MKTIIRKGEKKDIPQLLRLIKELAVYEKAGHEVAVSEAELESDGFGDHPYYEFLVAETENEISGIALFYIKYSTWKGKAVYLEDIIVNEAARKSGIGSLLFKAVCKRAVELGVRRMDWQVLDWNEPAIQFYKKYGASLDDEWLNGRLTEAQIKNIADL